MKCFRLCFACTRSLTKMGLHSRLHRLACHCHHAIRSKCLVVLTSLHLAKTRSDKFIFMENPGQDHVQDSDIQHLTSDCGHHHLAVECGPFLSQIAGAMIHDHKAVQRAEELRKLQQTQQLTLRQTYFDFRLQTLHNNHGPVDIHRKTYLVQICISETTLC